MTPPAITPKMCLYLPSWPASDQAQWALILAADDPLGEAGSCNHWSAASRKIHRRGYGEFLSFVERNHPGDLVLPPAQRVTKDRINEYLLEMSERPKHLLLNKRVATKLSPTTRAARILSIYLVIRAFAPEMDWEWLGRGTQRLISRAGTNRMKPYIPVSAADLFQWALRRLAAVAENEIREPYAKAVDFQSYLAIATLIACPVRRRAFCSLDVCERLQKTATGFRLNFRAEDMKDGKARHYPLHRRLAAPMRLYLEVHRPTLLKGSDAQGLWINSSGNRIEDNSMNALIKKVTEREYGTRLTVHDFRRVAATSIAEYDPEHAGIIRDILGHATMDMASRHYIRVQRLHAVTKYQETTDTIMSINLRNQTKRLDF